MSPPAKNEWPKPYSVRLIADDAATLTQQRYRAGTSSWVRSVNTLLPAPGRTVAPCRPSAAAQGLASRRPRIPRPEPCHPARLRPRAEMHRVPAHTAASPCIWHYWHKNGTGATSSAVAIIAAHLSFRQGHVRAAVELQADVSVALRASVADRHLFRWLFIVSDYL
jgi:hypothetical protein